MHQRNLMLFAHAISHLYCLYSTYYRILSRYRKRKGGCWGLAWSLLLIMCGGSTANIDFGEIIFRVNFCTLSWHVSTDFPKLDVFPLGDKNVADMADMSTFLIALTPALHNDLFAAPSYYPLVVASRVILQVPTILWFFVQSDTHCWPSFVPMAPFASCSLISMSLQWLRAHCHPQWSCSIVVWMEFL
jgi:hypothetical protein